MDSQGTLEKIRILLVDDDEVCLQIVSEMLRTWSYEVETVTHPMEALSILRMNQFDLILSDFHMPDMNGMELHKRVTEEFELPVIIISSDDRKKRIQTSLEGGALHYITKPVKPGDLRDIGRYAVSREKRMAIVVKESNSVGETSSSWSSSRSKRDESRSNNCKENSEKRVRRRILEIYQQHPSFPRKAKIVWTNSLHDRFLEAINILGLDKAVPKRILEIMNVPGLSRENIASHLQKYRLFLKQVAEHGSHKLRSSDKEPNSKFASNILSPSSPVNEYSKPFRLGFGKFPSFLHGGTPNFMEFSTQGAPGSSSSTIPGLGFERLHLILGQTSAENASYGGNSFHLCQSGGFSSSMPLPSTTLGSNFPWHSQGNTMCSNPNDNLASFDMSKHMYKSQQSETPMPFLGLGSDTFRFSNELAQNADESISTMGIDNIIHPEIVSSNPPISNCAGIRLTNRGEQVGGAGGQSQFNNFGINLNGVEHDSHGEFDGANFQPMLPSGYETNLPPMPLEQRVTTNQGEFKNFKVDAINCPSIPNDNTNYHQQLLGDGDYSNVFTQQVNQPYMNSEDFLQHSDISSGSYIANYENIAPQNELLISEFSNLCQVQDNFAPDSPFSLQQYNGNGQQIETNTMMMGFIPNDGFPSSSNSSEQHQQSKGEQLMDSILPSFNQNLVEQMIPNNEKVLVNDQARHFNEMDWEQEEYMQSILGTVRRFLEE